MNFHACLPVRQEGIYLKEYLVYEVNRLMSEKKKMFLVFLNAHTSLLEWTNYWEHESTRGMR